MNELYDAIELIHSHDKKIYLTLNSTNIDVEKALQEAATAIEGRIDGFIITDYILIKEIRRIYQSTAIYLSVLSNMFNSACIQPFYDIGINGFCFERNMMIGNMKLINKKYPMLESTAFISGNCSYTQTLCKLHGSSTHSLIYMDEGGAGELVCEGWQCSQQSDESYVNNLNAPHWCGLCSLPLLQDAGVKNLKIEGRSLDTKYKIKKVKYIKAALDALDNYHEEEYIAYCKERYEKEFGSQCKSRSCYYRI
jgi:collagenase-like PrtC family protease